MPCEVLRVGLGLLRLFPEGDAIAVGNLRRVVVVIGVRRESCVHGQSLELWA
jgi:hypothetical protein